MNRILGCATVLDVMIIEYTHNQTTSISGIITPQLIYIPHKLHNLFLVEFVEAKNGPPPWTDRPGPPYVNPRRMSTRGKKYEI